MKITDSEAQLKIFKSKFLFGYFPLRSSFIINLPSFYHECHFGYATFCLFCCTESEKPIVM